MSNNCFEHDFSKVAELAAYNVADFSFPHPVFSSYKHIGIGYYESQKENSISIKFTKDSVKVSEKVKSSVAGDIHTITITFECECISNEDYANLSKLVHRPHIFAIRYFGDIVRIFRTSMDGYSFSYVEDNGITKCTVELINGQGVTIVVPDGEEK